MSNVGEGNKKCKSFRMCLNLNNYQFETTRYSYSSTYLYPMVTTNQNFIIDTQKPKRKEHKHTTKKKHQKKQKEEEMNIELWKQLEIK